MNYKNIFEKSFSDVTPLTDNEGIVKNVTERAINMNEKKRINFKRPLIAIAAAVTTMAVATISVGAANEWDYGAVFRQIFGQKVENIQGNILTEATVTENTCTDLEFNLSAVLADRKSVVAIVDVKSLNGEDLSTGDFIHNMGMYLDYYEAEGTSTGSGSSIFILESTESSARLMFRFSTDLDISGIPVKLYIYDRNNENTKWVSEFTIDKTGDEIIYDISGRVNNKNSTAPYPYFDYDRIIVSPINVYVYYSTPESYESLYADLGDMYVVTNGEKINIHGTLSMVDINAEAGEQYRGLHLLNLSEPVDPEEITAIVIGDNEIKLR